jgi:hypothetical protein
MKFRVSATAAVRRLRPLVGLALLALLLVSPLRAHAFTITLDPPVTTVAVDDVIRVSVRIDGLADRRRPSLRSFVLGLRIDSQVLAFESVEIGDPELGDQVALGAKTYGNSGPISSDTIQLQQESFARAIDLNRKQRGSFVIATLILRAVAPGETTLSLEFRSFSDAGGLPMQLGSFTGSRIFVSRELPPQTAEPTLPEDRAPAVEP